MRVVRIPLLFVMEVSLLSPDSILLLLTIVIAVDIVVGVIIWRIKEKKKRGKRIGRRANSC